MKILCLCCIFHTPSFSDLWRFSALFFFCLPFFCTSCSYSLALSYLVYSKVPDYSCCYCCCFFSLASFISSLHCAFVRIFPIFSYVCFVFFFYSLLISSVVCRFFYYVLYDVRIYRRSLTSLRILLMIDLGMYLFTSIKNVANQTLMG